MKRKVFLSPFFLAVALSPAFFQTSYSCARGDTFLLSLELEVSGQDQIANFSTTNRSYAVTTSSSTAVLRVVTKDPDSIASYRWFAGGTAIGPSVDVGVAGGEVTVTVPNGQTALYVGVRAPEGAFDNYIIDVDRVVPITVAMTNNVGLDIFILPYILEVRPTSPITANQPFTADLGGTVEVAEEILDVYQGLVPGGTLDMAILDLKATVQPRGGATGAPVALGWGSSVPFECELDGTACDPANDEPGTPGNRGNTDCLPILSFNPCLRFADLPTSTDCAPAGLCDSAGKTLLCQLNGFCVIGSLLLPLDPILGASYMAGDGMSPDQTEALFGWIDTPPPVTAVGVPNIDGDGTWNMISSTYSGVAGELGIAMTAGGLSLALEGVMGVDSNGPDGVGVPDDASPTPDSALLCFPVGGPFVCGDGITDACEECDDGNNVDGDGCQADCTTLPSCDLPLNFDEVLWEITGGAMAPMVGTIDTSAPGSYGGIEVFGLPPSIGPDYTIEMQATTPDQETTCIGFADFGIEAAVTTDVLFSLQCANDSGACMPGVAVRLKASSPPEASNDGCARLTNVVVSPLQTSVGNDIDLSAMALDMEGDPIFYIWSSGSGSIADPNDQETTYTCTEAGDDTITIMVSDDDFNSCLDDWTVEVTCVM